MNVIYVKRKISLQGFFLVELLCALILSLSVIHAATLWLGACISLSRTLKTRIHLIDRMRHGVKQQNYAQDDVIDSICRITQERRYPTVTIQGPIEKAHLVFPDEKTCFFTCLQGHIGKNRVRHTRIIGVFNAVPYEQV